MKLMSRRFIAPAGALVATALSVSVLALVPALANSTTPPNSRLAVDSTSIRAAAGSCSVVVITPQDQFGVAYTTTDTFTVTLSENPSETNQDLDFCVSTPGDTSYRADAPVEDPSYVNGGSNSPTGGSNGTRQSYKAGPGITNGAATSGGTPDASSNATHSTSPSVGSCGECATSNPSGVDAARYVYRPGSGGVRVGVVGLRAGSGVIKAFFDDGTATGDAAYRPDADELQSPDVFFTVTAGGQPGTAESYGAVTQIDVDPVDDAAPANTPQRFTATLLNGSGDGVRGVQPLVQVASNGANPNAAASCDVSDNSGVSRCSFTGTTPGTDTLTVYVNKAGGSAGPDSFETKTTVTRTTTKPAVAPAEARYLDLTPKNQTVVAGRPDTFTATITDVNGAPAQNVSVTFTESGPGQFDNGSSSYTAFTDVTGRVRARITTNAAETGTQNITAAISTVTTQCSQPAGAGNGSTSATPPGRCSDTATGTVTTASPSPTPTPSRSTSATPTATVSQTPSRRALSLRTSTPDIQPNQAGVLDVSGEPNASVELMCYTRPNLNYSPARGPLSLNSSGSWQFRITPGANTRCYVRYASNDSTASNQIVINVHTSLSLSAYRDGARKYHFQGTNLPRRSGQLITLYRYARSDNNGYCDPHIAAGDYSATSSDPNCIAIRTATARTNSSNVWRIDRTFTGSGQFVFQVRTSQTLTNGAGVSNSRLTIIH